MAIDRTDRSLRYKHMVVRVIGANIHVICYTDNGEPAVYVDPATAELRAAQLRERNPIAAYRVISFQVL